MDLPCADNEAKVQAMLDSPQTAILAKQWIVAPHDVQTDVQTQ